jgi:hypothetical protein
VRANVAYTLEARTTTQMVAYSIRPMSGAGQAQAVETPVAQPVVAGASVSSQQGGDVVVMALAAAMRGRDDGAELEIGGEVSNALRGSGGGGSRALALVLEWAEAIKARVRRLTPLECERLQGLPDNHTRIAWGRKPAGACPDGPRYRAIGNGLPIPDVRWLAARIAHFHALKLKEKAAA